MKKCEQNTRPSIVEIENLPDKRKRVKMHKNTIEEERTDEQGQTYTVFVSDESEFTTADNVTVGVVADNFEDYWSYSEYGENTSERYKTLVSTFIREKYTQDDVEAIDNNYLSDPENETYKNEFSELQTYRAECKKRAKEEIEK